jgi:putative ABC transport system permease protein
MDLPEKTAKEASNMKNIFKIAWRNLFRYKRRTLLTGSLIASGVLLVIVFSGLGYSFKNHIIGLITNTNTSDIQIHAAGYLDSIDNQPLDLTMNVETLRKVEDMLKAHDQIKAYALRLRFPTMLSNFQKTTAVRVIAIQPETEVQTCPDLPKHIMERASNEPQLLKPGEILVPEKIAKGLNLQVGSDVVLVATNNDGSVNGLNFRVGGIAENLFGHMGMFAYMHLDDARTLLRMESGDVMEIAVKLKRFDQLEPVYQQLKATLNTITDANGQPLVEVHTWEALTPFTSVARIVDLLIVMIRVVLIGIVLISILNVMMMSVYERIPEIGTIASIGTPPRRIAALFLMEGFALGLVSSVIGSLAGMGILLFLNTVKLNFTFGLFDLSLAPEIPFREVLLTLVIVVIVSVLSSLQPALHASRLEPVEALRHV